MEFKIIVRLGGGYVALAAYDLDTGDYKGERPIFRATKGDVTEPDKWAQIFANGFAEFTGFEVIVLSRGGTAL